MNHHGWGIGGCEDPIGNLDDRHTHDHAPPQPQVLDEAQPPTLRELAQPIKSRAC